MSARPDPALNVPAIDVDTLVDRYDLFLLDAYGVLVDSQGALPGAARFLARLRRAGKESLILSNDASRSPETSRRRYAGFGLDFPVERIVTSGLLLGAHFAQTGLVGRPIIVLGTDDSLDYVRQAGGVIADAADAHAEALVVADDDGYPFLETVNDAITVLLARLERDQTTALVLPNPDLVFPRGTGRFGVTAGGIAAMIEAVLRLRDPSGGQRFVPLGKPHRPMFEEAARRFPAVPRARMVMIGDQLGTDILGAARFGIDSVLVQTGIGRLRELATAEALPTWTLPALG